MPVRSNVIAVVLPLALSACAFSPFADIDTAAMSPGVASIAARAQIGDKRAQYDLGMLTYLGLGTARDCPLARRMFAAAATQTGGTTYTYLPPVTEGGAGSVIPIDLGPLQPGLPQAKRALELVGDCESEPADVTALAKTAIKASRR